MNRIKIQIVKIREKKANLELKVENLKNKNNKANNKANNKRFPYYKFKKLRKNYTIDINL